jgi:hypothetical protein
MKLKLIVYWIATAAVVLEMLAGGVTDLVHGGTGLFVGEPVVQVLTHLGYPTYLLMILGVCKVPCALVLLAPRLPRLKEWAYAGALINYTGAFVSNSLVNHSVQLFATGLPMIVFALASWALRPQSRTLGILFPMWAQRTNGKVNVPIE